MNDPHVAALKYRLTVDDSIEFQNPPDVKIETDEFTGRLSQGLLTLEPKDHFEREADVKPIADVFVLAWEIDAGLRYGPKIHFHFEGSEIVDRKPVPGTIEVIGAESLTFVDSVSVTLGLSTYPNPPCGFAITPEVEILWSRYCRYIENRESMAQMAFWCLTFLEAHSGSEKSRRKSAASKFDIHFGVLQKLGDLTSAQRGDNLTSRKASARQTPLSDKELSWIESTIKAIIRHLATRSAGGTLEMNDLPSP